MTVLVLLGLGVLGWLWFSGKLRGWTVADIAAVVAILGGLRLVSTGSLPGLMLLGGGAFWIYRNWARIAQIRLKGTAPRPIDYEAVGAARVLLGVDETAGAGEIRSAHRRLIADAHRDQIGAGRDAGDADLAYRLNAARDLLLDRLKPPTT